MYILGIKDKSHNLIKNIYKKATANIIMWETGCLFSKISYKLRMSSHHFYLPLYWKSYLVH